ncbi:hypothetical protein [Catenulispora rubra]|uniref:hypothetical protein n=1 Tax=Catenulispora rubra TaxID=280293 RepID=UPI00189269AD|nr:hypothetical protein [Catenulispora rubra]
MRLRKGSALWELTNVHDWLAEILRCYGEGEFTYVTITEARPQPTEAVGRVSAFMVVLRQQPAGLP